VVSLPINRVLETVARAPRRKIAGHDLKMNLGSGTVVAPGWVNFDLSPNALVSIAPTPVLGVLYKLSGSRHMISRDEYIRRLKSSRFVLCDLARGIPARDGVATVIYTSHFLEHLRPGEGRALIRESFRVLAPGGLLRITVPDVRHFAVEYVSGRTDRFISFLEGDHGYEGERGTHRSFWDSETLRRVLDENGFVNIRELRHHEGETPDLALVETHTPVGALYVEARTPGTVEPQ
jgi:SAM-dependent methyltransferase